MRYRIGVADFDASWSAFAFDLPGCVATAATRDELLAITPVAIADHVAWLRRGGIDVAADDAVALDLAEEVRAADEDAADGEFCFADDLAPTTEDDITVGIAIMEASRRDLLDAVRGVPDAILDWRPPLSAMAQVDEWKPQPLTIREILADIAAAEGYYRTALHDGPVPAQPDDAHRDLSIQRQRLIDAIRALTPESNPAHSTRHTPTRPWQTKPEHWTARKVIRRVISHERFHTAEIRQRLSWLLVGVPRFHREDDEP